MRGMGKGNIWERNRLGKGLMAWRWDCTVFRTGWQGTAAKELPARLGVATADEASE